MQAAVMAAEDASRKMAEAAAAANEGLARFAMEKEEEVENDTGRAPPRGGLEELVSQVRETAFSLPSIHAITYKLI